MTTPFTDSKVGEGRKEQLKNKKKTAKEREGRLQTLHSSTSSVSLSLTGCGSQGLCSGWMYMSEVIYLLISSFSGPESCRAPETLVLFCFVWLCLVFSVFAHFAAAWVKKSNNLILHSFSAAQTMYTLIKLLSSLPSSSVSRPQVFLSCSSDAKLFPSSVLTKSAFWFFHAITCFAGGLPSLCLHHCHIDQNVIIPKTTSSLVNFY